MFFACTRQTVFSSATTGAVAAGRVKCSFKDSGITLPLAQLQKWFAQIENCNTGDLYS